MRYLLVPDVHSNWHSLAWFIEIVRDKGVPFDEIVILGDVGIYPGRLKPLFQMLHRLGYPTIHIVDGNHENHFYLHQCRAKLLKKGVIHHQRGDVTILPDGCKIGWIGGALNVDREQEYINETCNYPTPDDIKRATDNFNKVGGVDVIFSHSCPTRVGVGIKGSPYFVPGIQKFICDALHVEQPPLDDVGDFPLTELYHGLIIKPTVWCFGHFHQYHMKQVGNTLFCCTGICDNHFQEFHNQQLRLFFYDSSLRQLLY